MRYRFLCSDSNLVLHSTGEYSYLTGEAVRKGNLKEPLPGMLYVIFRSGSLRTAWHTHSFSPEDAKTFLFMGYDLQQSLAWGSADTEYSSQLDYMYTFKEASFSFDAKLEMNDLYHTKKRLDVVCLRDKKSHIVDYYLMEKL
jgi:hypothetical protein